VNPRRAALALRTAAVAFAVSAVVGLGCSLVSEQLESQLRSSTSGAHDAIYAQMRTVGAVSRWSAYAWLAATTAAWVGLASALRGARGGRLAAAAAAFAVVHAAMLVFEFVSPPTVDPKTYHFPAGRQTLWAIEAAIELAADVSALLAAARARPGSTVGHLATLLAFVLALVHRANDALLRALDAPYEVLLKAQLPRIGLSAAATAAFAVAAFQLSRGLSRGLGDASAVAAAPGALATDGGERRGDPSPFRLLGWTMLLRGAVAIPLGVVATIAGTRGATDAALAALYVGTLAGLVVAGMFITSIGGQLRLPEPLRDDGALRLARVLAVVAPIFDFATALAAGRLLSAVGQAKQGSLAGMPSLSEIESLQTAALWLGRATLAAGIVATYALLRSLGATARALADQPLEALARRATALLVTAGAGGLVLWIVVTNLHDLTDALPIVLLAAVTMAALALAMFAELVRLAFSLARALAR
jgi:hypothetical protein